MRAPRRPEAGGGNEALVKKSRRCDAVHSTVLNEIEWRCSPAPTRMFRSVVFPNAF